MLPILRFFLPRLLLPCILAAVLTTVARASSDESPKYALLVGCTEYPANERINELWGPGNDVPLFGQLLHNRFGFPKENLTVLVGSPVEKDGPGRANIVKGFTDLVEKSAPGVQIVIMMNGHGTQLPVPASANAAAPGDPEPDGLDEVFLPGDVGLWKDDELPNSIRDDEIAAWLKAMKTRGAHVWIIFDCCHSGTMTRDVGGAERQRGVEPSQLGVPDTALEQAANQAKSKRAQQDQSAERSRGTSTVESPLDVVSQKGGAGSITAFYAAQSFEKAPELPRPHNAPRSRKHYFGLFSFVLCQTLEQTRGPVTYRSLARQIVARYRAERGSRGPTPLFDGELNRDLLGGNATENRDVTLYVEQSADGALQVNGGMLAGLGVGTILAVHEIADRTKIRGYVRVASVEATTANVESTEYANRPVRDGQQLVDSPCRIVSQNLDDLRIPLAITGEKALAESVALANLKTAFLALPAGTRALVRQTAAPGDAAWLLQVVSPEVALRDFGLQISQPAALLRTATGSGAVSSGNRTTTNRRPKIYRQYSCENPEDLTLELARDLRKIYNWQNVWRVAVTMQQGDAGQDLQFHVNTPAANANAGAERLAHVLQPDQRIELNLQNDGFDDQWLTLLYLDADFGIHVWLSTSLKSGQKFRPLRVKIDGSSVGSEGFVVLSVPMTVSRNQPDYSFLEQSPLGTTDRAVNAPPKQPTLFQQLLYSSTAASGIRQRAAVLEEPTNPAVQSWTWTTVPP